MTFRHGREEDEMMGVSFKKELVVDRVQIHPAGKDDSRTKLQVSFEKFSKIVPCKIGLIWLILLRLSRLGWLNF